MTDTPTDRESVEKLAKVYDTFAVAEAIWKKATKRFDKLVADTLRALLTRAETAEARVAELEAERNRYRRALNAIKHTFVEDSHGGMKSCSGYEYQAIARAALTKETGA